MEKTPQYDRVKKDGQDGKRGVSQVISTGNTCTTLSQHQTITHKSLKTLTRWKQQWRVQNCHQKNSSAHEFCKLI